jgi:hypothetical protein
VDQRPVRGHSSIGYQNIETAHAFRAALDKSAHLCFGCDVGSVQVGVPTHRMDARQDTLSPLAPFLIMDQNVGSSLREGDGNFTPNDSRATGDERCLSMQ